jgi:hypothetical protein
VQENINEGLGDDAFAVQLDLLPAQIGLRAKFGHHVTIDTNASRHDEFFGLAPRGNAGTSKDFLQSVSHGSRSWQSFGQTLPGKTGPRGSHTFAQCSGH